MSDKALSDFNPPITAVELAAKTLAQFYLIFQPGTGQDAYDDGSIEVDEFVTYLQGVLNLQNASTTVKGVTEEGTELELQNGDQIGSTGARLFFSALALLGTFATSGQNGNILYVAPANPFNNDGSPRIDAIGRDAKPYITLEAALAVSQSNDTIVCFSINEIATTTFTGTRHIILTADSTLTLNHNNAGSGSDARIWGQRGADITLNVTGGNATNFNLYDFDTVTLSAFPATDTGSILVENTRELTDVNVDRANLKLRNCQIVGDIIATLSNCQVEAGGNKKTIITGDIRQTNAGTGALLLDLQNVAITGYISAANRNATHDIAMKDVSMDSIGNECIAFADSNVMSIALDGVKFKSDQANVININSTLIVTITVSVFNALRNGGIIVSGSAILDLLTSINDNVVTDAQIDEYL